MLRYKKMLFIPCMICSVLLLYVACNGESQQACSMDARTQDIVSTGVPLVEIVIDDAAKTAIHKQKESAVYCFLTKGVG